MKRVLLIEDLPQVAQHLQSMLAREKEIEVAGVQSDPAAAIAQIATEKPDIVMLDGFLGGKQDFSIALDVAKRIRTASAGTRIIMVTVPQKGLDPKSATMVDAVFVLPGGANELAQVLGVGRAARPQNGLMIAVYSPKGGTGKTTLAVNLATVLRRQGKSVALMDGVMQFGSVRHVLQVPPATRSFVDLPTAGAQALHLTIIGEIPTGWKTVSDSLKKQQPFVISAPQSSISRAVEALAHVLVTQQRK